MNDPNFVPFRPGDPLPLPPKKAQEALTLALQALAVELGEEVFDVVATSNTGRRVRAAAIGVPEPCPDGSFRLLIAAKSAEAAKVGVDAYLAALRAARSRQAPPVERQDVGAPDAPGALPRSVAP